MNELVSLFLAFGCGVFCGFIGCAAFAVGGRADGPEDFDGGFSSNYPPRVHTKILSTDITTKDKP